ncbi:MULTISPECIES: GNAT family N-acetyltransferase [unclassified Flavobacterium]|uniref:GNAT family N-acetyltransferase n=1 Tax=unclassified Flavobacterium TaxID=196869 RepID=UPI00096825B5|nr:MULTISPECIES: GNAT family N-acetyltransferase [unclassified Flavobacterium]MBN9284486.1 GNAT family N-acetyltransferase [Flavobacterium sp.]OJV72782.1 MAG: GNAT family N-acetyltransferase [Flavobacterium sp. 40-81]
MTIENSTLNDLTTIFEFYAAAVAYQKTKFNKHWQDFDKEMVQTEIRENRQWKILIDGKTTCVFATTYEDPFIWGEANAIPAVYLHRIVTHPDFKGNNFVVQILAWAKEHAKTLGMDYVRMDTWGDNEELIQYYCKCGFHYLGNTTPTETAALPKHYSAISLALFEVKVD